MYKLVIAPNAQKELKKLKKIYQEVLIAALEDIQEDPFLGKPLTRELSGRFSYKISVFRIIYKVNQKEKTVSVISAGHRSIVYN